MSDPLNNLGSIWHHSDPSDVPYSPHQFLTLDFFSATYSKTALVSYVWMNVFDKVLSVLKLFVGSQTIIFCNWCIHSLKFGRLCSKKPGHFDGKMLNLGLVFVLWQYTGCPVNWYSLSISIPDFPDGPMKKS